MPMNIEDADFLRLVRFIKSNYGIDLSRKRQLITSRLSSSLEAKGFSDFKAFVSHVTESRDKDTVSLMLDKLTTNYTYFMRETEHFDFFTRTILPQLVQRHQRDKSFSIWSAGCSTGEEPYNLSMYIMEYLGREAAQWDTRILATDISQRALTAAQKGIYELPDTIPSNWRTNYFKREPNAADGSERYSVAPAIRNNVIFRTFNLMEPIQFKRKFDVIFCRNVMIYFDTPTKDALVNRFYDATLPGGYLLISHAENLSPGAPYIRVAASTFQKR